MSFEGKTVVVTGAAQGIGLAISHRFASEGARVAMIDVEALRLRKSAAVVRSHGPDILEIVADVSDNLIMHDVAAHVAAQLGSCDVLVSNAGVLLRGDLLASDALTHWQRTMAVNLDGCFNTAQAFTRQLKATRGCIVNVASIHAFVAVRNSAAYTASKGGVKQLTQALALELGADGVRVNAVAPGITDTDMTSSIRSDPVALEAFLARVPLHRTTHPDDVANAVRFLASQEAACISGVTLPVDGGYCAT